jgi:hypothetical protein
MTLYIEYLQYIRTCAKHFDFRVVKNVDKTYLLKQIK